MSAGISRRLDFRGRESSKILSAISGSNYPSTPAEGYALTQANFPGLIEAFVASGISGNNLVGSLGNITIACSTGWQIPYHPESFRPATGAALVSSGTWPALDGKHIILIHTGYLVATIGNVLRLGAAAGPSVSIGTGVSDTQTRINASNLATFNNGLFPAYTYAVAMAVDQRSANGLAKKYCFEFDTPTTTTLTAAITGDLSQNWSAFATGSGNVVLPYDQAGSDQYNDGVFLLGLSAFPDDINMFSALEWMSLHPGSLYPGFYHRS